jgi:Asp/Glu/hydantoin racemase
MAAVCIQVINPNTSAGMTETIGRRPRMAAAPGRDSGGLPTGRRAVDRRPL